jgi:biopolymer transport protein ExbD
VRGPSFLLDAAGAPTQTCVMAITTADGNQAGEGCEECQEGSVVAEINITPLTDVFLVLLIIFMVTSTALTQSKAVADTMVHVTPPSAQAATPIPAKPAPVVTVTRAGEVYLGRDKVDIAGLEAAIRQALSRDHGDTVLLRGDTSAQLGTAVKAMSIARKAGARNIQVLTSD